MEQWLGRGEEPLRVRPDPLYSVQELIERSDGSRVGIVRPDPFYPGDDLVDTESSDLD